MSNKKERTKKIIAEAGTKTENKSGLAVEADVSKVENKNKTGDIAKKDNKTAELKSKEEKKIIDEKVKALSINGEKKKTTNSSDNKINDKVFNNPLSDKEKDKALKVDTYIPKPEKPKLKMTKYTIMLIPNSTDGAKSYELTIDKIACAIVAFVATVVIVLSIIFSLIYKNYKLRNDSSLLSQIETLRAENESLTTRNSELEEIAKENGERAENYLNNLSARELLDAQQYIPNIRPYKGSGIMLSDILVDGATTFNCLEDAKIVSTAVGKVTDISEGMTGYVITVDHGNGFKTQYTTTGELNTKVGDDVVKGETIATILSDDQSFSYAVLLDDKAQDAKEYIK